MEERERNGLSGLRIDVWETPTHPDEVAQRQGTSTPRDGSPVQHSHPGQNKSSVVISPIKKTSPAKEREANLSEGEEDLDFNAEMPSYNENIEENQSHAEENSRRGYYRVAPMSDGDISMKSINDDEAAPGSNKTDPVTRTEGADQRLIPPEPRDRPRNRKPCSLQTARRRPPVPPNKIRY